jgi:hypothetical protein
MAGGWALSGIFACLTDRQGHQPLLHSEELCEGMKLILPARLAGQFRINQPPQNPARLSAEPVHIDTAEAALLDVNLH